MHSRVTFRTSAASRWNRITGPTRLRRGSNLLGSGRSGSGGADHVRQRLQAAVDLQPAGLSKREPAARATIQPGARYRLACGDPALADDKGNFQRVSRQVFEPVETSSVRLELNTTNGDS